MARKHLQVIAGLGTPTAFTLTAVQSAKNDFAFKAEVTVAGSTHMVAAEDGRIRSFRAADDFLAAAGALSMIPPEGLSVALEGMELVQPKPFTGNIIAKNTALVAAYVKRKTDGDARVVKLTQEIALMQADPTVPAAMLTERQAQKDGVVDLVAWLASEITRINAILNP